jgi:hypothetical protein
VPVVTVFCRPRGVASAYHRWYRREVKRVGGAGVGGQLCYACGSSYSPQMNVRRVHYCL